MRAVVPWMIVALLVLHQDNWLWEDTTLDFGFMPRTLLFHAGISLAAGFTWFLAIKFCWPAGLDTDATNAEGAADA